MVSLLLNRDRWLSEEWGVVNCANDMAKPIPLGQIEVTICDFCRFKGLVARIKAYQINLKASCLLLNTVFPIRITADDLLGDPSLYGYVDHGVVPRCVHWELGDGKSAILWDPSAENLYRASRISPTEFIMRLMRRVLGLK